MAISQYEPCTKFLGPNARVFPVVTNVSCYMQLFNLQKGDYWIPGKEGILQTRRLLLHQPGTQVFGFYGPEFSWWIIYTKLIFRINCRHDASRRYVFRLWLYHNIVRWGTNDLDVPALNIAYGGQVVISWQQ